MSKTIDREIRETRLLLRSIPAPTVTAFVLSVIIMNLLANKSVNLPFEWLALDCGIIVSWLSFLCVDVITKHFGPKAAFRLTFIAVMFNLFVCAIFKLGSIIPGTWGESYVDGSEAVINTALDNTFGGIWYVLLGSTIAFALSAAVNILLNVAVAKGFKNNPDSFLAFAMRSYVSTAAGQFVDNMTFALLVSHVFFGWTMLQCVMCSFTGMIAELICEMIFSPIGYKICASWKKEGVGAEYLRVAADAA